MSPTLLYHLPDRILHWLAREEEVWPLRSLLLLTDKLENLELGATFAERRHTAVQLQIKTSDNELVIWRDT